MTQVAFVGEFSPSFKPDAATNDAITRSAAALGANVNAE